MGERPAFVRAFMNALLNGDTSPTTFGRLDGKLLRKTQQFHPEAKTGPLQVQSKIIDKIIKKRLGNDHLSPEEFADGLNGLFHGTRTKVLPETGNKVLLVKPGELYSWRGAMGMRPEGGAVVTGMKQGTKKLQNELLKSSGGRTSPPLSGIQDAAHQQARFSDVEDVQKLVSEESVNSTSPGVKALLKSLLSAGGATAASVPMSEAEAFAQVMDQPLETPYLDPVSMFASGFGVGGMAGKLGAAGADALLGLLLEGMSAPGAPPQPWAVMGGD